MTKSKRRCPHAAIHDCPLYWASHDGGGASCGDTDIQSGCAVEKGASYDALAAKITVERYAHLRAMICRPMLRPGMMVRLWEFEVRG